MSPSLPIARRFLPLSALFAVLFSGPASASPNAVHRVPEDFPSIQAAVNAASAGDEISVRAGSWCGATITKRVKLVGRSAAVTIVGCAAPVLFDVLRVGFFLPDGTASGTVVRNFNFNGLGVSNQNFDPLALAVFGRQADDVVIAHNRVAGTVQAFTNTGGSGWSVSHNVVRGLTAFTCGDGGRCGGGDAIVFQQRDVTQPRATRNLAVRNDIQGRIPDGLDEFSMVGVLALGQDGAVALANKLAIPANPDAEGDGQGVVVSDHCCGLEVPFHTSINSIVVANDGRQSEFAVVIERELDGGTGNSQGALVLANLGVVLINPDPLAAIERPRAHQPF
jgi:hypothetical protein